LEIMNRPDTAHVPEVAHKIGALLESGLGAQAVYLFGSHARGDAGPDSDLDFLVVVPDSSQSRYFRSVQARRLVSDIPSPKDIIVLTRAEWDSETRVRSSLPGTVLREGIQLHG
jgi:predicted nucleotidyltransferase